MAEAELLAPVGSSSAGTGARGIVRVAHFDPYYAEDTDGIHFEVCVDGVFVQAHAGADLLTSRFAARDRTLDVMALFMRHRADLERAVKRRVRAEGPETVILHLSDLEPAR